MVSCRKHCLAIAFCSTIVAGMIVTPLLWFRNPKISFQSASNVRPEVDSVMLDLSFDIENMNYYPVSFRNLELDVYDSKNNKIAHLTHMDKTILPKRKNYVLSMQTELDPTIDAILDITRDCASVAHETILQVNGTCDGVVLGLKIPLTIYRINDMVKCDHKD